uniref:Secreted protein n=1 Tax=Rhabditophanes sp. KR3021 TaxID=114890 RepID=A0AC35U753_9BILA
MKFCINFLLIALLATSRQVNATDCKWNVLVKCFINVLDDWAWTLYELKENVVTIRSEQCEHLRQLNVCIEDTGPEIHQCNHNEIVEVSNTVSDLLTHRKNAGSFLKSYYLLTFACSEAGQEILDKERSCLNDQKVGQMTISAGTYLSEKFIETETESDICVGVNAKLNEYNEATKGLCGEQAQYIMCKSLEGMFKGMHVDKLYNCDINCGENENVQQDVSQLEGENAGPDPGNADALNTATTKSGQNLSFILIATLFTYAGGVIFNMA